MTPPRRYRILGLILIAALATAAAPIRVGIFTGNGQYLTHTSMSPAITAITSMLQSPVSAGLGADLIIPPDGFSVSEHGCKTANCRVNKTLHATPFIQALDTLDVVAFVHYEGNGGFSDSTFDAAQRLKLENYFRGRGVVSVHATTSGSGANWPQWDSLHGARGINHTQSDRLGTLHLDASVANDHHGKFLNRGLPDTSRFLEEWYSFSVNGEVIRAVPDLRVTVRIDESSYEGGMGGARVMGDHPMSWYRTFPSGGRFFYTAIGHRSGTYTGSGTATAPEAASFLRRQIYNAILWAAGVDSTGTVSIADRVPAARGLLSDNVRLSVTGGALTVSLFRDEPHSLKLMALNGRVLDSRRGALGGDHTFANTPSGLHVLVIETASSRTALKVMSP